LRVNCIFVRFSPRDVYAYRGLYRGKMSVRPVKHVIKVLFTFG